MSQILAFSMDLPKIDKSKIKEITRKDGSVGKFYDVLVTVNDEQDQFGNIASMTTGQTQEERQRKDKKVYLCNGKRIWASASVPTGANVATTTPSPLPVSNDESDLPF